MGLEDLAEQIDIDKVNTGGLGDLGISPDNLFSAFWSTMPAEYASKFSLMLDLGIGLLIAGIIYIGFILLIKFFSALFGARKLKKISLQLDEVVYLLGKNKGHKDEGQRKKH